MTNQGITGAEVVDIFNYPPYGCSRRLYFQKIGEKPIDPCSVSDEQSHKAQVSIFGDFVSAVYESKTKRKTRKPNQTFINPRYPFILGDCDRLQTTLRNSHGSHVPLELRSLSRVEYYRIRKHGLPEGYYTYQLHHQMIAKQATWASLGLFCPDIMEMMTYDITYDETTAAELINAEKSFVNQIQWKIGDVASVMDKCRLCGYQDQCFNSDSQPSQSTKEEYELNETITQIEAYLGEKETFYEGNGYPLDSVSGKSGGQAK